MKIALMRTCGGKAYGESRIPTGQKPSAYKTGKLPSGSKHMNNTYCGPERPQLVATLNYLEAERARVAKVSISSTDFGMGVVARHQFAHQMFAIAPVPLCFISGNNGIRRATAAFT